MGTRQVRISERLYARVKSEKRAGETMGEALERMVGGYDLSISLRTPMTVNHWTSTVSNPK